MSKIADFKKRRDLEAAKASAAKPVAQDKEPAKEQKRVKAEKNEALTLLAKLLGVPEQDAIAEARAVLADEKQQKPADKEPEPEPEQASALDAAADNVSDAASELAGSADEIAAATAELKEAAEEVKKPSAEQKSSPSEKSEKAKGGSKK